MQKCYYNENDKFAARWLRNLIDAKLIPAGDVDERSICDVSPDDIRGYRQVHFFAGIGGWPLAMQLAGWPDDRPVGTGSCPCQPFSISGKKLGEKDDRHLWPEMYRIIRQSAVATWFGEQVAAAIGYGWLDRVFGEMESIGYACGASVLGAFSVGAPHVRKRLYWVCNADGAGSQKRNSDRGFLQQTGFENDVAPTELSSGSLFRIPDTDCDRRIERQSEPSGYAVNGGENFWSAAKPHLCLDGNYRRVESGVFPLAPRLSMGMGRGVPALGRMVRSARINRTQRLRGYGNAIVPQVAAEFVMAFLECELDAITTTQAPAYPCN